MEFDPIFNGSPVAMLVLDPNGTILRANSAFVGWLGLESGEAAVRNWWNLVSPSDLGRALTQFGRLMQGVEASVRFDLRLSARQGEWKHGSAWCRRLDDNTVFCQIADISARALAAAELADLRREAVELRREIDTLRGHLRHAAELLDRLPSSSPGGPCSDVKETCRMASRPLNRQPCDLSTLIRRAAAKVGRRLPAIEPAWHIADMPTVAVDAEGFAETVEQMLEEMAQAAEAHTVEAGSYVTDGVPVLFFRYEPRILSDKSRGAISDPGAPGRLAQRHGGACWVEHEHGRTTICLTFEPIPQAA